MSQVATIPHYLTFADWSFLQARLLWCYEGEVDPKNRRMVSQRNQLSAWWLQAGSVTVKRGGQSWVARAGDWLFCGPQSLHQEFSADARILSINFKLEWPSGDSLVDQIIQVPARAHPALGRTARALQRFITRRFPHAGTDLHPRPVELTDFFETQKLFSAWAQAYLKTMLAAGVIPARMEGMDSRVLVLLRKLDRHDWRSPLRAKTKTGASANAGQSKAESLANAADLDGGVRGAGLSAGHLDRLFIQQLGLTPHAYLQKRRLESALAALADSSVPAKKIAFDLGFSSASHFSHWLKKAAGKSPREARVSGRR